MLEHASVAAFARFSLQLLELAAPPDLLEAAQRAMADELRHAEMCFALATAYAGVEVAPTTLSCDQALERRSRSEVILDTFLEGCIGETIAALEARESAALAQDEAVKESLRTIARDEERHALLAWQFVRWALHAEPQRTRVLEKLERVVDQGEREPFPEHADDRLEQFGVLAASTRAAIRLAAVREVIRPALASLRTADRASDDARAA